MAGMVLSTHTSVLVTIVTSIKSGIRVGIICNTYVYPSFPG